MATVWLEALLWFGCPLLFIAPFAVCWLVWPVPHLVLASFVRGPSASAAFLRGRSRELGGAITGHLA